MKEILPVILSRSRELDVGRNSKEGHNYVSFAATGNKFRRFAREIAGDLRYSRTIIHCPPGRTTFWQRWYLAQEQAYPRSTSSRGYASLSEDTANTKSTALSDRLVTLRTVTRGSNRASS